MPNAFIDLEWEDLEEWAGPRSVSRGKGYVPRVVDLRQLSENDLIAWTVGGRRYATRVWIEEGQIQSLCMCPVGFRCKHAVAVALRYLEEVDKRRSIPVTMEADDERVALLKREYEDEDDFDPDDEDDYDDREDDFDEDEMEESDELDLVFEYEVDPTQRSVSKRSASERRDRERELIARKIDALSVKEARRRLMQLADDFPEVRQALLDSERLGAEKVEPTVESIREEMQSLANEQSYTNPWRRESHIPDYGNVRNRLARLIEAGHADEALELGWELLELGIAQVELANDEGETAYEIARCMEVVFRAFARCSLSEADRIIWEIDAGLADEYGILDHIDNGPVSAIESPRAWSETADRLCGRLKAMPVPAADEVEFSVRCRRQRVIRWIVSSLERAGREDELIDLYEREAPISHDYEPLIGMLLRANRVEEARNWATRAHDATLATFPGVADNMRGLLTQLAERDGDAAQVAAYQSYAFFDRHDLESFRSLRDAATKAGLWDHARPFVLRFLETGEIPPLSGGPATTDPANQWPLPAPEIQIPLDAWRKRTSAFPDHITLFHVAVDENRMDDAVQWGRAAGSTLSFHQKADIADAVSRSHPDDALGIWLELAKNRIAMVKPDAYVDAGRYLEKMRDVYRREDREDEWRKLLDQLRHENKRRPRCLDVLNRLSGERHPILPKRKR